MVWKAVENIGEYKEGDIVPENLAIVWDKMYKVSPVKQELETKVIPVKQELETKVIPKKKIKSDLETKQKRK